MNAPALVCWHCGASLAPVPLPFGRLAECPGCRAYLHVCRLCRHFDPSVAKRCREQDAEEVQDKEHANFCEYFRQRPGAFRADSRVKAAKSALDSLFAGAAGPDADTGSAARGPLDGLVPPARPRGK